MILILPCPFCGGRAQEGTRLAATPYYFCPTCLARGPRGATNDTEAIVLWNSRPREETLEAERDDIKQQLLKLNRDRNERVRDLADVTKNLAALEVWALEARDALDHAADLYPLDLDEQSDLIARCPVQKDADQ